jgi:hypothetical protein
MLIEFISQAPEAARSSSVAASRQLFAPDILTQRSVLAQTSGSYLHETPCHLSDWLQGSK